MLIYITICFRKKFVFNTLHFHTVVTGYWPPISRMRGHRMGHYESLWIWIKYEISAVRCCWTFLGTDWYILGGCGKIEICFVVFFQNIFLICFAGTSCLIFHHLQFERHYIACFSIKLFIDLVKTVDFFHINIKPENITSKALTFNYFNSGNRNTDE